MPYDVLIRASSIEMLQTVLAVIKDDPGVTLVSCGPSPEEAKPAAPDRKQMHYVGGVRNKGISGQALVLRALTNAAGPQTLSQIERVLTSWNPPFSAQTATPILSKLRARGIIEAITDAATGITGYRLLSVNGAQIP